MVGLLALRSRQRLYKERCFAFSTWSICPFAEFMYCPQSCLAPLVEPRSQPSNWEEPKRRVSQKSQKSHLEQYIMTMSVQLHRASVRLRSTETPSFA